MTTRWTAAHAPGRNPRAGTSVTELMVALFIVSIMAVGTSYSVIGNREALLEDQVVTGLLTGIRQCRQEAVTQNQPVTWWITNGYLAWWCDTDGDNIQEPEETETLLLNDFASYSTYPTQGQFDGRGTHSTSHSTFTGMMVWIQLDHSTHMVTVSSNGYASRYSY